MRRAYIAYTAVVWPVREGRVTLACDSVSEPCDEGALPAMAKTSSNNEANYAPPLTSADGSATDDAGSPAAVDAGTAALGVLTTSLRLVAVASAVGAARSFAADSFTLWQVPAEVADNAILIVSELVTNAVRAGGIDALAPDVAVLASAPTVGLRLTLAAGSLLVEVWDGSVALPVLRQQYEDTEGGRGLFLVSMLAERWSYYPSEQGGKVVWAELAVSKVAEGRVDSDEADLPRGNVPYSLTMVTASTGTVADAAMLERVLWGLQRRER